MAVFQVVRILDLVESLEVNGWVKKIESKAKELEEKDFVDWYLKEVLFDLFNQDRQLYRKLEKALKDKYRTAEAYELWRKINRVDLIVFRKGKIEVEALSSEVLKKLDREGKEITKQIFNFISKKFPDLELHVSIGKQPVSVAGRKGFRMGIPVDNPVDMWLVYDNRTLKDWKKLEDKFGPKWVSTAYDVFHELSHVLGIRDEKKADRNALKLAKEFFKS